MNASASLTGRPPWSVVAWVDDTSVYVEIPGKSGPPYIMKFALTDGGLGKALNVMRNLHRQVQPRGGYYKLEPNPMVKVVKPTAPKATIEQRAAALNILRKLGTIR